MQNVNLAHAGDRPWSCQLVQLATTSRWTWINGWLRWPIRLTVAGPVVPGERTSLTKTNLRFVRCAQEARFDFKLADRNDSANDIGAKSITVRDISVVPRGSALQSIRVSSTPRYRVELRD